MPFVDLNTPTQLVFQWGWLLLTKSNAVIYLLLIAVFLLGALVSLPGEKPPAAAPTPTPVPRPDGEADA